MIFTMNRCCGQGWAASPPLSGAFYQEYEVTKAWMTFPGFQVTGVEIAKVEETENNRYFGVAYQAYRKRTKMFIPYLL
jgi:protein-S-isoprenylcysteine O-methyltransferase Ste14